MNSFYHLEGPIYVLEDLPKGYCLFEHRRGVQDVAPISMVNVPRRHSPLDLSQTYTQVQNVTFDRYPNSFRKRGSIRPTAAAPKRNGITGTAPRGMGVHSDSSSERDRAEVEAMLLIPNSESESDEEVDQSQSTQRSWV
jgi:hypothetical protein